MPIFRGISVIPVLTIDREPMRFRSPAPFFEGGSAVIEVTLAHTGRTGRDRRDRARAAADCRSAPAPCSAPPTSPTRCMPARVFWSARARPRSSPARRLATELPYLPGVATPSEVMAARALGVCVMKFFPGRGARRRGVVAGAGAGFPRHRLLPHRRHRRAQGRRVSGAAQRADGRRLVDGAEGRDPGRRLGPGPPARRTRRLCRATAGRLATPSPTRA